MAINNVIGDAWIEIHGKTDKLRNDIENFFKLDGRMRQNIQKNLQDSLDKVFEDIDYDKMSSIKIKVEVDADDALEQLSALRDIITDEVETIRVKVNVDDDSLDEIQALNEIITENVEHVAITPILNKEQAEEVEDDLDEVAKKREAVVTPETDSNSALATNVRLAWLARPRVVEFYTKINENSVVQLMAALSGTRMLQTTMDTMSRIILHLDESIPKISFLTGGLTYVGGLLTSLVGDAASLIVDIGRMVGLLIPLPGLMFGFVAGFGLTIAALKDWNEIFPKFKDQMAELQDTISERFWDRAKEPIEELINTLLPMLTTAFGDTSSVLGGFFGTLATEVTQTLGPSFDFMFGNLNRSILISQLSLDSFVHLMDTLGRHGSEYLPDLARWFGNITERFDEWITAAEERGDLKKWTDQAVDNLGYLGDAIWQTGRLFYGLGVAAEEGGGATLKSFSEGLRDIADVVNGEPFSSKLTQVFASANEMISDIARVSGPAVKDMFSSIADILSNTFDTLGSTLGLVIREIAQGLASLTFKEGFQEMIEGVAKGLQGFAPYIGPIFDGLGSLMTIIGSMAENFLPLLGRAFEVIALTLGDLEGPLISLIEFLSGALETVLSLPAPVLALGAAFVGMSGGIINLTVGLGGLLLKLPTAGAALSAFSSAIMGGQGIAAAASAGGTALMGLGTASGTAAGGMAAGTGALAGLRGAAMLASKAIPFVGAALTAIAIGQFLTQIRQSTADTDKLANALVSVSDPADTASNDLRALMTTTNYLGMNTTATGKSVETFGDALEVFGAGASKTFADGMSGVFSDLGKADEAFRQQAAGLDETFATMIASGNVEAAKTQFAQFSQAAIDNGATIEEVTDLFPAYSEAINEVDLAEAVAAEEAHERALDQKNAIMDNSIDTASEYLAINQTIADELMGFKDAELGFKEALNEVNQQLRLNSEGLNSYSEAGIENQRSMNDYLSKGREYIDQLIERGATEDEVSAGVAEVTDGMRALGEQFGAMPEDIDAYAQSIGMLPSEYALEATTNIDAALGNAAYEVNGFLMEYSNGELKFNGNTQPAEATLADFITDVGTAEGSVSINGQDFDGRMTVAEFTDWIESNDPNLSVGAQTDNAVASHNELLNQFTAPVSKPIDADTEAALDNMDAFTLTAMTPVTKPVEANTEPAWLANTNLTDLIQTGTAYTNIDAKDEQAMMRLSNLSQTIESETSVTQIDAETSAADYVATGLYTSIKTNTSTMHIAGEDSQAQETVRLTKSTIDTTTGTVTVAAQKDTSTWNSITSAISNLSQTVWVNVKSIFQGDNGGLLPSVKSFAGGGVEKHVAQIARASTLTRIWAEPETGGEAYIPLAMSKRSRSLDILEEVARIFGYMLAPKGKSFADGGIYSSSKNTSPENVNAQYNVYVTINPKDLRGIKDIEEFVTMLNVKQRQLTGKTR